MSDFTDKTLITEEDIRAVATGATLRINEKALVTPLAADLARERHINFERIAVPGGHTRRRIAIGADHGGFEMKEAVKSLLAELGCDYKDFGTNSTEPVDYPDIAHAVALAVSRKTCDLGIMIDGAGIGSCMVANKVPGVRAAMLRRSICAKQPRTQWRECSDARRQDDLGPEDARYRSDLALDGIDGR